MSRNRTLSMLLVVLLGVSVLGMVGPQPVLGLQPHRPILIESDDDFASANGVRRGSGSASNPYIIEGWTFSPCPYGIRIQNTRAHFIIRSVQLHFCGVPVYLQNVTDGRLEKLNVLDSYSGVKVFDSSRVTITRSEVSGTWGEWESALTLGGSTELVISENKILRNRNEGVWIPESSNITLVRNTISFNGRSAVDVTLSGVFVDRSHNITFLRNTMSLNAGPGILLHCSTQVTLSANRFFFNGLDIRCQLPPAPLVYFDSHTITQNNMVNNKPLRYYKNCQGLNINHLSTGQLIIANCKNIRVTNIRISNTFTAILMAYVNNIEIERSYIADNAQGIVLNGANALISNSNITRNGVGLETSFSSNLTVTGNSISQNGAYGLLLGGENMVVSDNEVWANGHGVYLKGENFTASSNRVHTNKYDGILIWGDNFEILNNTISANGWTGIHLTFSSSGRVVGNTVSHNGESGIGLHMSTGNRVYRNNLLEHAQQARDNSRSQNFWDNGYPGGGNYWSDYTGSDNCSGPNQTVCPDPDGIGDTAYKITYSGFFSDPGIADRYPLTKPFGTSA